MTEKPPSTCPKCTAVLSGEPSVCPYCGQELSKAAAAARSTCPRYCPRPRRSRAAGETGGPGAGVAGRRRRGAGGEIWREGRCQKAGRRQSGRGRQRSNRCGCSGSQGQPGCVRKIQEEPGVGLPGRLRELRSFYGNVPLLSFCDRRSGLSRTVGVCWKARLGCWRGLSPG